MKELYYQPEISEFHVGFEYEVQQMDECGYYINEYCEFEYEFGEKLNLNRVRVKYLDKDDIGSLGFEVFNKEIKGGAYPSEWYMFKHENDSLIQIHCQLSPYHFNKNNGIIINLSTRLKGNISILIKNKSELKSLLTKLNIV